MKLAISRAAFLAAASVCMARADIRHYLNGIHIERVSKGVFDKAEHNGVLIVSTDGHRLFAAHDESAEYPDDWPSDVTIKFGKESIRAFKLAKNLDEPVFLTVHGDNVLLEAAHSVCGDPTVIDGTFPNWRRIIKDQKAKTFGWFNPVYLADFEKIMRFLARHSRYPSISIRQDDVNGNATVHFGQIDYAFGVVMPIRNPDGVYADTLPKWAVSPSKRQKKTKPAPQVKAGVNEVPAHKSQLPA